MNKSNQQPVSPRVRELCTTLGQQALRLEEITNTGEVLDVMEEMHHTMKHIAARILAEGLLGARVTAGLEEQVYQGLEELDGDC